MKRVPIKILIIIIITGIICICGELGVSRQLDKVISVHNNIMDEYVENREYMAKMKSLLYQHQALLANHMVSSDKDIQKEYEDMEASLQNEISSLVINFSYRMKEGEREKVYHRVYSDYCGYVNNAATMLEFSRSGQNDMAIYYNDNVLKPFLSNIDVRLDDLDRMTVDDIRGAEKDMEDLISYSDLLRNITIATMMILILSGGVICFRITANLDKYKRNLEEELVEKNKTLQEKNENMIKLQDGIIIGMANLIESRNGETGEHVKRTSVYVEMIARKARQMGVYADVLTDEYIEKLKKAAPLHDVGKIVVSDSILMKPAKLTSEEFEQIKLHAPKGGVIISECFENIDDKEYVNMACDVASYHHEKWQGTGYSKGLKGEEIPLSARIMAIADVFDALISKRCYKEEYPISDAYRIIEDSAGEHFDPKLVEVFVSLRADIESYVEEANKMLEQP